MNRILFFFVIVFLTCTPLFLGCEERPTLPDPVNTSTLDTSYIQVYPAFGQFTNPQDVMVGIDQLLYVADTDGDRIVMMNRAGHTLSERHLLKPTAIAQDTRLDLLVACEIEAPSGGTMGAILRLDLFSASHSLELAHADTVWRELARPRRRFTGLTVFSDNNYLAVRSNVNVDSIDNVSFIDPDARILLFDQNDVFISPLAAITTRAGSGITDIFRPTGIAAFPGVKDFVMTQLVRNGIAYGALWMRYELTTDFEGWLPKFDPADPDLRNTDFIRPNRFVGPEAVAIDASRRDVFIADAELDSVFKFNNRGKLKGESFGLTRSGGAMLRPTGVAFFEKVLYVLDAPVGQPGKLLRFKLTTDFPR